MRAAARNGLAERSSFSLSLSLSATICRTMACPSRNGALRAMGRFFGGADVVLSGAVASLSWGVAAAFHRFLSGAWSGNGGVLRAALVPRCSGRLRYCGCSSGAAARLFSRSLVLPDACLPSFIHYSYVRTFLSLHVLRLAGACCRATLVFPRRPFQFDSVACVLAQAPSLV